MTPKKTGFLVDTSQKPELVIDGSRGKELESLEQVKVYLDMFLKDNMISMKTLKDPTKYKSPYKVVSH